MNKYNVSKGDSDVDRLTMSEKILLVAAMTRQTSLSNPVFELTEQEAFLLRKAGYMLWAIQSESED